MLKTFASLLTPVHHPSVMILGYTLPSISNPLQISKSPTGIGLNNLVLKLFL